MSRAATEVGLPVQAAYTHPAVRLISLRKNYGHVVAADGVDLEIAEGEFFTMLGPSGSGKTTLLRIIAGFERPDSGTVELGGIDVTRQPPYPPRREHRLPRLCAVPPHVGDRERRVWPQDPQGSEGGSARTSGESAGDGQALRPRRAQAAPTFGWPTPTGCTRGRS